MQSTENGRGDHSASRRELMPGATCGFCAATLAQGLEYDDKLDKARLELRGFVERIVIPQDGLLEVAGNLGMMLSAAQGQRAGDPVGKIGCGGPGAAVT